MRTNPHFREFLELDTQLPESVVNTPVKIAELGDLNLGGRDFLYVREEKLLFVAMSDMNITSRLDAYLTNVKLYFKVIMNLVFIPLGKRIIIRQLCWCGGYMCL